MPKTPKTEEQKFLAAIQKLRRDIAKFAEGGEDSEAVKLTKAAHRLEDRLERAQYHGTVQAEPLLQVLRDVRAQITPAKEAAYLARRAYRDGEIKRLKGEIRDRAPQGYEKELAISRGGYRPYRISSPPQDAIVTAVESFVAKLLK